MLDAGDEVMERVAFVLHAALLVPAAPHLAPTTHVRDGEHHAALEQFEAGRGEQRIHRRLVGAIGVHETWGVPIVRDVGTVDDADGHLDPIVRSRPGA